MSGCTTNIENIIIEPELQIYKVNDVFFVNERFKCYDENFDRLNTNIDVLFEGSFEHKTKQEEYIIKELYYPDFEIDVDWWYDSINNTAKFEICEFIGKIKINYTINDIDVIETCYDYNYEEGEDFIIEYDLTRWTIECIEELIK